MRAITTENSLLHICRTACWLTPICGAVRRMSSGVGSKRRSGETLDYDEGKGKRRRDDEDGPASRSSSSKTALGGAGASAGGRAADARKAKGKSLLDEDDDDTGAGAGRRDDDEDGGAPDMRSRILSVLSKNPEGLAVKSMAKRLGTKPELVAEQLGELVSAHRIEVLRQRRPDGTELQIMRAVSRERAEKLKGLAMEEMAVLAIIERSGGAGVWSRSLKMASKMQQVALNKIIKRLEARKLVKGVASVAFKNRRMYMAYDASEWARQRASGGWHACIAHAAPMPPHSLSLPSTSPVLSSLSPAPSPLVAHCIHLPSTPCPQRPPRR